MRSFRRAASLTILLTATGLFLSLGAAIGMDSKTSSSQSRTALQFDTSTRLDCNALEMFVYNDGNFAYDNANVLGKTDGLYFPRGTKKTVMYSAGLWIGGKVNGETRLAVAEYSAEFFPGPMADSTFQADNPAFHVYKVNRGDTDANPDYANWPVDQGAPVDTVDGVEVPAILGDQMLWTVFNDANPALHTNDAGATDPLGVEVQLSAFAYARGGALGQTLFLRYLLINKGVNTIDSTFISLWADPDIGNASDDLVGCDTLLSLGYCYNDGVDSEYGPAPPAVGFDFFQGPIVPGAPSDSAYVSGQWIPGFKNLPMTSFNKYINGTDPHSRVETYNYMKGLLPNGEPVMDPDGNVTTYFVPGNPVTGEGWIDEASADRRFMMSSGPFTMMPGDTQEVVAAVIVGQGANPLNSIDALKLVDEQAQGAYNSNFDIPVASNDLEVWGRGHSNAVELFWSSQHVGDVMMSETLGQEFHFEGYNVFQGMNFDGPWKKIATYDVINEIALIYDYIYDPDAGGTELVIVQKGTNSGLQFQFMTSIDYFSGQPLENDTEYHYAVTAYYYDVNHTSEFHDSFGNLLGHISETLESPLSQVTVMPQASPGVVSDTAVHLSGGSDGMVIIEYLEPGETTCHDYNVTFNSDATWNLLDLTASTTLLANEPQQPGGYGFPVVDGLMIRVLGPVAGVQSVTEVHNGFAPVDPPDNVNFSLNSTGDWYMDPGSSHALSAYSWQGTSPHDFEIRFTEGATEHALGFFNAAGGDYAGDIGFDVPIEFWDLGIGTLDDPSDDRRITFMVIDDDVSNSFSWGDGLYIWDVDYDDAEWENPAWHTGLLDPDYAGLHYGRFWFYDFSGELERPDPGTVVRVLTNKMNGVADVFEFCARTICGDFNCDHAINITDAVYLINYIFIFGAEPACGAGDVDCSGSINISDAVYLISYIFADGPAPCAACPAANIVSTGSKLDH